jgi:hypothetical protein
MLCLLAVAAQISAQVTLVKDGDARVVIYVPGEIMDPAQKGRERLRASVHDLAGYLEKISGAKITISTDHPAKGADALPILIGPYAEQRFGPLELATRYQQGWRLVVTRAGIGMLGESDEAVSYAIYELLDRLGCRWYLPGELGERIPSMQTITMPVMDVSAAPSILGRNIGPIDADFQRRNRCGGLAIECNDIAISMRSYIPREQLAAHPLWNAELDGKREVTGIFCWSNPAVADAVADGIMRQLEQQYRPVVTLSTPYGDRFCACVACKALDAGGWHHGLGRPSMTDRFIAFANRVAERVTGKYPRVLFGMLMKNHYIDPPLREKPHANLLPVITSIATCRAHSVTARDCPDRQQFAKQVEGWARLTDTLAIYEFGYNLAEVAAPYPMLRWEKDIPFYFAHKAKFWMPYGWVSDVLPNLDAALPGMYLGIRMAWYPQAAPAKVLDEFYTGFYGAAAKPMRRYWQAVDNAWQQTPAHAGRFFGYDRRFTPMVLTDARGTGGGGGGVPHPGGSSARATGERLLPAIRTVYGDAPEPEHRQTGEFGSGRQSLVRTTQSSAPALSQECRFRFLRLGYVPHRHL